MKRACWYNLTNLTKDTRRIIYSKLDWVDHTLVRMTHNSTYRPTLDSERSKYCVDNGMLEILQCSQTPLIPLLVSRAAFFGHLHILKWVDPSILIETPVCVYAAMGGHLHIIQWARSLDPPLDWNYIVCHYALKREDYKMLRWCVENGVPTTDFIRNSMNEKGLLV